MVGECTIPYIGDHHPSWDFRSEPTRNSWNDVAGSAKRLAIHSGLGKLPGLTHHFMAMGQHVRVRSSKPAIFTRVFEGWGQDPVGTGIQEIWGHEI